MIQQPQRIAKNVFQAGKILPITPGDYHGQDQQAAQSIGRLQSAVQFLQRQAATESGRSFLATIVGLHPVQNFLAPTVASGGTYTLSCDGHTTSSLAYNASTADVQTALRALAGLGDIVVSGNPLSVAGGMTFTMSTPKLITATTSGLTPATGYTLSSRWTIDEYDYNASGQPYANTGSDNALRAGLAGIAMDLNPATTTEANTHIGERVAVRESYDPVTANPVYGFWRNPNSMIGTVTGTLTIVTDVVIDSSAKTISKKTRTLTITNGMIMSIGSETTTTLDTGANC